MKCTCDYCGKVFDKRPSHMKENNYCCKEHRHADKYEIVKCDTCGKEFEKLKTEGIFEHNFCCRDCASVFTSERMTAYNVKHNPTAMTQKRREKLRFAHLGKGEGKTYTKTFGRHTHRIVAEQMLGRPLNPGEVVHHIDENKRNNNPDNLMIFASQAEHKHYHETHKR